MGRLTKIHVIYGGQNTDYFAELDKSHYATGIKMLEQRWPKPIEIQGDYFQKYLIFF